MAEGPTSATGFSTTFSRVGSWALPAVGWSAGRVNPPTPTPSRRQQPPSDASKPSPTPRTAVSCLVPPAAPLPHRRQRTFAPFWYPYPSQTHAPSHAVAAPSLRLPAVAPSAGATASCIDAPPPEPRWHDAQRCRSSSCPSAGRDDRARDDGRALPRVLRPRVRSSCTPRMALGTTNGAGGSEDSGPRALRRRQALAPSQPEQNQRLRILAPIGVPEPILSTP